MMNNSNSKKNIEFQLCSVPDSEGLVLELSNTGEAAFLEIKVDSNDVQWIRFFSSDSNVELTLNDMQKAIDIAKREVVNVSFDD